MIEENPQNITIMCADQIDVLMENLRAQHQIPKQADVEILILTLFRTVVTLINQKLVDPHQMEEFLTMMFNSYFASANLDMYVKQYDLPQGTQVQ